jgi:HK97 family phage portal protein
MGLLKRLFGRGREERAHDYLPASAGIFAVGGFNDSGVVVTESNALTCSAVWACAQIIAEAVANLPAHVLRREDNAKLYDHPVATLLHREPNPYMTAFTCRSAFMLNALLWGAAYAVVERDVLGVPTALYPVLSSLTRPFRTPGGALLYQTIVGGQSHFLTPDQVLFMPGLSLDGITGLNTVAHARQTVGTTLAMERYAAKLFGSGGNVGGILKTPPMKEDALKAFVMSWRENYAGIENAFKVAVLPDGYDFKQTSMDPERGQMTQARTNQVLEVARFFRVPPHMLGIMDKASYASIEQTNLEFYQHAVQGWVTKFEQESNRKLLLEREKPTHEVKLNMDAMLRSSTQERYAAHATAINAGFLTVNEARAKENLPPVEGGDVLRVPLNMGPAADNKPQPDKAAARALIEDAARRVLTKEAKALARLHKKHHVNPTEFRQAWAGFYRTHIPLVARVMAVALQAAGLSITPDDYAAQHVTESTRQLEQGFTIEQLEDWPDVRAAEIADSLTRGGDRGNANA